MKSNYRRKPKNQLCWTCQNACGRCVWSKYGLPVPGWTATKNNIPENGEYSATYHIYAWPRYKADRKK